MKVYLNHSSKLPNEIEKLKKKERKTPYLPTNCLVFPVMRFLLATVLYEWLLKNSEQHRNDPGRGFS